MNLLFWLDFIESIISSCIWPSTILIIFFSLRSQIIQFIGRIDEINYKDIAVKLRDKIEEIAKLENFSNETELAKAQPYINYIAKYGYDTLYKLADLSPNAAIIEAWNLHEKAIYELAISLDINIEKLSITQITSAIVNTTKSDFLRITFDGYTNYLREIRNVIVHSKNSESRESTSAAINFINLASIASYYLSSWDGKE